jgi:hypothetical protein
MNPNFVDRLLVLLLVAYPQFLPSGDSGIAEFGDGLTEWVAGIVVSTPVANPKYWAILAVFLCSCVSIRVVWENSRLAATDPARTRAYKLVAFQVVVALALSCAIWAVAVVSRLSGDTDLERIATVVSITAFALASAIVYGVKAFVVPYFGDVARYVQSATDTVRNREEIRERGLALLRALHEDDAYQRVVIVAHSLGSVVAYDLIRLFWAEYGPTFTAGYSLGQPACVAMIKAMDKGRAMPNWLGSPFSAIAEYRASQKNAFLALRDQQRSANNSAPRRKRAKTWKISDFVTVGSPLTHADFLLARTTEQFGDLVQERTLPVNPPVREHATNRFPANATDSFLYSVPKKSGRGLSVYCHHGAPFSVVRWTNIYDWRKFGVFGDFVSGPLRDHFGSGILDFHVKIRRLGLRFIPNRLVTHTLYWQQWSKDQWGANVNPVTADHSRRVVNSHLEGHGRENIEKYPGTDPIHLRLLRAACDLKFASDTIVDAKLISGMDPKENIGDLAGWLRDERKGIWLSGFAPAAFRIVLFVALALIGIDLATDGKLRAALAF